MNLVRREGSQGSAYRPRSIDDQVGRLVEDMFEDIFSATLMPYSPLSRSEQGGVMVPRVSLKETDKAYELEADIPGVEKSDIRISIENRRVTIEAEEKRDATPQQAEGTPQSGQSGQSAQATRMERYYRRYATSFMLPTEVDDTSAQARLENGVLRLTLPKKQADQARRLTVQ